MKQGDMIDDSSFIALIVDKDDIKSSLLDSGMSEDLAIDKAKCFINSDYFRRKFTDGIMLNFWELLESMTENEDYLK